MQQNDVYKGATGDKPIIGENTFFDNLPPPQAVCLSVTRYPAARSPDHC